MNTITQATLAKTTRTLLAVLVVASMLLQPGLVGSAQAAARDSVARAPYAAPDSVPSAAQYTAQQTEPMPGTDSPAPAQGAGTTAGTGAAIDCSDPIPGFKARLFAEDEVMFSYRYRDDNQSLRTQLVDFDGSKLTAKESKYYGGASALSNVRRLSNTGADLNGDGKAELVTALRDKSERLAATTDSTTTSEWYADSDAFKGDNLTWVNADAGNLDRTGSDEEVAIAFEDDNNDIEVVALDGNSSGQIGNSANKMLGNWYDPKDGDGRGDVSYVAVATGDLNGDGYNNEIVTVFRDGNDDLQMLVVRRNPNNSMSLLWNKSWTNHDRGDVARDASYWRNRRPIDVTTGDLDGDMRDEVVIGFRSGDSQTDAWNGKLQMLVVKTTQVVTSTATTTYPYSDTLVMDDQVWVEHKIGSDFSQAATMVSLAGADLDGDGRDEIAVGYNRVYATGEHESRKWQQHLVTYKYVDVMEPNYPFPGCTDDSGKPRACLVARSGSWKSGNTTVPFAVSEDNVEAHVVIDAGDLDLDGKDEIVLGREVHDNGDIELYAFDADSGLQQRGSKLTVDSGSNRIEDFWLSMGDHDGDSWYGTYTNSCHLKTDAQVQAVLHAPPYWPGLNAREAEAEFGATSSNSQGATKAIETTVSGSVTQKAQFKEIGPSFTYEWEKAWATETMTRTTTSYGMKFATMSPALFGEEAQFGAVELVEAKYWCYDYEDVNHKDELGVMEVCLPRPTIEMAHVNYPLEWWYDQGPKTYADSWVPVGANLAYHRTATVSGGGQGAGLAVDDTTNGDYFAGSVARTNQAAHAWWELDLGGVQAVDGLQLWPCTKGCSTGQPNVYVFASEEPFGSEDPAVLIAGGKLVGEELTMSASDPTTVAVNQRARYLRVQLASATPGYLELAEVMAYGMPGAVDLWPDSAPQATATGFALSWPNGPQQPVKGQLLLASQYAVGVRAGSSAQEWSIGMGTEEEHVTEGSTASKATLGMEMKFYGAEASAGTSEKTSYILAWSKDVDFGGQVAGTPKEDGGGTSPCNYDYAPYIWLQSSRSTGGTNQAFMVLDYYISSRSATTGCVPVPESAPPPVPLGVPPQAPQVTSTTHPDPATWVITNTASFVWAQPPGDTAVIDGYDWVLDRSADTVPGAYNRGPITTETYFGLDDGVWYMHVRALGHDGQWGETAHRRFQVDTHAPQVQLALDPPEYSGHSEWYSTPVGVGISGDDGAGAGVAAIEVSPDGATWQPYGGVLLFDADTPGTTVYARAKDALGQASEPISTTIKIDMTAPDSHIAGGQGPGVWTAQVITNSVGNQELVLTGEVRDALAGGNGMAIRYDGADWQAASVAAAATTAAAIGTAATSWSYNGGHDVGAGYHIFYGRAEDQAGNTEAEYEIGRVLWYPQAAPNIEGSTLTASPATVRPGDTVTLTLVARNAGPQEAYVAAIATVPEGLSLVTEDLAPDVTYDLAAGVLMWPGEMLWPGETMRHTYEVRVNPNHQGATLVNQIGLRATWPNINLLSPDQQQPFLAQERTLRVTADIHINAGLPVGTDTTAPWVSLSAGPQVVTNGSVTLGIVAEADAKRMYIREWVINPLTGVWQQAQDSGWLSFAPTYNWVLSPGQGVKYLGVWVADAAGNISTLDESSTDFVNRSDANQVLLDGERIQYRGDLEQGSWIIATLLTIAGDPDMYIWRPGNGFRPDLFSTDDVGPGQVETLGGEMVEQAGRYLLEVQAAGDSEYNLSLAGQGAAVLAASHGQVGKEHPQHPLSLADPLSANQVDDWQGARPYIMYLPAVKK